MIIRNVIGLVATLELPLILVIAPLLLFPTPQRAAALALLPLLWICAWVTTRRLVPATSVNVALWGVLVMAGVGLLSTPNLGFALGKIAGLALGVALYWAVVRWAGSPGRTAWLTAGVIGSGGALSVMGLLGAEWRSDKLPIVAPIIDALPALIRGIPGAVDGFNPNAVAGCLILLLPVQGWVLLRRQSHVSRLGNVVQAILLCLAVGTLVLLQSRGAWLGLGLGALLYLLIRRPVRAIVLLAATVVVGVLVFSQVRPAGLSASSITESETVVSRMEMWSRGIYMLRDHPFTGVGMNHFRVLMPALYPAVSVAPDDDVAHAHNQLLHTALDLGIPGLIAYLALWIGSIVTLALARRVARTSLDRAVLSGVLVGLLAHFCFGLTDAIPLGAKVGVTYWLTLALGMAVAGRVLADDWTRSLSEA